MTPNADVAEQRSLITAHQHELTNRGKQTMTTPKLFNPCHPRKRFTTEQAARVAAMRIANTKGDMRYVVPCGKCFGWHLEANYHKR